MALPCFTDTVHHIDGEGFGMSKRLLGTMGLAALLIGGMLAVSLGVGLAHGEEQGEGTPEPVTLDYTPTYYEHVEPILEANCMSCHMEGEFGHDSFEMDTEEEVLAGAEDIALVVSTGYMPPWPPGELSPHFLYDRSLSNEEIAQIVGWVEAGMPMGDAANAPAPEAPAAEPVVEPDVVLTIAEPYTPNSELNDDYRCFLMDPGFTQDTFITGYDIVPDNTGVVHHTVLFPASPAQRVEADSLNGADGKPGWSCFGGSGLSAGGPDMGRLRPLLPVIAAVGGIDELRILLQQENAVELMDAAIAEADTDGTLGGMIGMMGGSEGLVNLLRQGLTGPQAMSQTVTGVIGAWVPGSTPSQFPADTGLLMPAGGFIVMQMHYNTQANSEPDQSQLILDVTTESNLAAGRVLAINAPVEIPCPEGVTGNQCNRASMDFENSDLLLAICGQTLADYANQDPTNATSYCNVRVPTDGWALAIMSHQHYLGVSTRTVLNPDTPEAQILIDIPVWDFDWQGNYWFAEPIWLNQGDIIQVTCTWDNSVSRQNPEPTYIVGGEGTEDEMCLNFVTMLPAEPGSPMPVTGPVSGS
jgi:hypothetical protein